MKKLSVIFMAVCILLASIPLAHASEKGYIISKGDALSIRVWGEGDLSAEVMVRPDGKISLPGIGEMTAAGISPRQLQARVTSALKELVFEPLVSVSVNTFPSNSMVVHGQGATAAVVPLLKETSLLELLSSLQLNPHADLVGAYLERDGQKIATNFKSLFKDGVGTQGKLEILANDRLYIPLQKERLIFVDGAVGKPTSVPFVEDMTILEAIHKAGGFNKFADKNSTIITRKGQRIPVRLSDLINNGDMTQNVPLQAGDLIVVDTSWF